MRLTIKEKGFPVALALKYGHLGTIVVCKVEVLAQLLQPSSVVAQPFALLLRALGFYVENRSMGTIVLTFQRSCTPSRIYSHIFQFSTQNPSKSSLG